MSKPAQIAAVAFAVGFGLALLIALLTTLAGETNMGEAVLVGIFGSIAAAFVYGNLSGNRAVAKASDADKTAALAAAPPQGKALVFVYRDAYVGKLVGMDIAIDERPVAQIKSPRFTMVTVSPGRHVMSAGFSGFAGAQVKRESDPFDFAPGTTTVLKIANRIGLVQGGLKFEMQPDLAAAKQRLARMPMTPADVPEL